MWRDDKRIMSNMGIDLTDDMTLDMFQKSEWQWMKYRRHKVLSLKGYQLCTICVNYSSNGYTASDYNR